MEVHSKDILLAIISQYQSEGYYVKVDPKVITNKSGYKDIKHHVKVYAFIEPQITEWSEKKE